MVVMIFCGCGVPNNSSESNSISDSENETTTKQSIIPKNTTEDNTAETSKDSKPDENIEINNSGNAFDSELIASELSAEIYSYKSSTGRYNVILVVKNTSQFTINISANLRTFDNSGNMLSAKSDSVSAIPPETETILTFLLDEAFSDVEYDFEVKKGSYIGVIKNLTYTHNSAKNKEVISITNNGDISARFVKAHLLFFMGNELVYYNSSYFTDSDSEIKSGKTISDEVSCRYDYDGFMIFLTGYGK